MGSKCHDSVSDSYGTAKCKVCKKKFKLGKWHEDETTCDFCKVDHELNKVQHPCKACGWKGSITQMEYIPPTELTDNAYHLCPKCKHEIMRTWCGKVDYWDHA